MHGPDSRTMQRISRACDRPPFQPQFGAGVDAPRGEHTHDAVDIGAAYGSPLVSTCHGTVFESWHYGRGAHPDRPGAGTLSRIAGYVRVRGPGNAVVYYAHLNPVLVEPGQSVGVGTLLGCVYHMGDRGGPAHLHYQLRHPNARGTAAGGRRIDPLARLRLLLNRGGWRTPPPAPTGDLPRPPE